MYDINTKHVKKERKFYFMALIVGIIILLIFIWFSIPDYIKKRNLKM